MLKQTLQGGFGYSSMDTSGRKQSLLAAISESPFFFFFNKYANGYYQLD